MAYPTVNGVPLDQIFEPYTGGTKAIVTGYTVKVDGVDTDLKDLLAPIYLGSQAAITNYKVNNVDLKFIFAAKGSVHYNIPALQGNTYSVAATASGVFGQPGASVNLSLTFSNAGTYSLTANVVASGGGSGGTVVGFPASGTWLPSGWTASDSQIQFSYTETVTESGPASKTNPAASYQSLSASRSFLMSAACGATSPNGKGSSLAMTLRIKQVSTGSVITTTFTVACDAASGV